MYTVGNGGGRDRAGEADKARTPPTGFVLGAGRLLNSFRERSNKIVRAGVWQID